MPAPITIPTIMAIASKKVRAGFGEVTALALNERLSVALFARLVTLNPLTQLN
jgi:hypothetical protein